MPSSQQKTCFYITYTCNLIHCKYKKIDECSFNYRWRLPQMLRMSCSLNYSPVLPWLPCEDISSQHRASQTETCCSDWRRPESPALWCGLHSPPGPSGSPEDTQGTRHRKQQNTQLWFCCQLPLQASDFMNWNEHTFIIYYSAHKWTCVLSNSWCV